MSSTPGKVFVARLAGLVVYDPAGDRVGKVRDMVVALRADAKPPRVLGLVLELVGRRTIFCPMTRVTSIDAGHLITTGVLNMRRFEQRSSETLLLAQLLDRSVTVRQDDIKAVVYDVGMEQGRHREWFCTKVAVHEAAKRFGRRGQSHVLDWSDVEGLTAQEGSQGASNLLATLDSMRPADLANVIRELPPKRRHEIAAGLGDERLADVLEEMSPDDAADLIAELAPETAEQLLTLMEPGEAKDVRRLLSYEESTAGGLMTTEPVILAPDATLADALARVRQSELVPSLAAMVYVCRAPLETPSGRFLGAAHFQRLLREPPSTLVSAVIDHDVPRLRPDTGLQDVAGLLATYNQVASPVVDEFGRLVGVVSVDDVLDHLLPQGWRDRTSPEEDLDGS